MMPTKQIGFLACLSLVVSAPALAAPYILTCTGPFAPDSTHERVVAAFGAENVTIGEVDLGEGVTAKGTIVFPNDPASRLEVSWQDKDSMKTPWMVRLRGGGPMPPEPKWVSAEGIAIGDTLEGIETRNGNAFTLAGFEWHYGGTVLDWKGGTLAKPAKMNGCSSIVRLGIADGVSTDGVVGDGEFLSSNPKMKAAKPAVYEIGLTYE